MIEEFLIDIPIPIGLSIRSLNYNKIIKLNNKDFARLYLELMNEYRDKDGWWKKNNVPNCWECHEPIDNPKNLRRYYGQSLHPNCFKKVYKREGKEKSITKEYFDRVANLILVN